LSDGMSVWDASQIRLLSRIWLGSIGRKGRNTAAPAMLSMLPKFELIPIRMYLSVLADVPAFSDSLRDRRQARLEKDDVGRGPRDIGALVDADADVREVERRRVIDAVGEVADDRAAASGSGTQRTRVSGVPL
jgi:hypothetical protein